MWGKVIIALFLFGCLVQAINIPSLTPAFKTKTINGFTVGIQQAATCNEGYLGDANRTCTFLAYTQGASTFTVSNAKLNTIFKKNNLDVSIWEVTEVVNESTINSKTMESIGCLPIQKCVNLEAIAYTLNSTTITEQMPHGLFATNLTPYTYSFNFTLQNSHITTIPTTGMGESCKWVYENCTNKTTPMIYNNYKVKGNKLNKGDFSLSFGPQRKYYLLRFSAPIGSADSFNFTIGKTSYNFALDPDYNVSTCGDLGNESGATYYLNTSVFSNETCFRIVNDSVTLDCQGNEISSNFNNSAYGVYNTAYNNMVVRNCKFKNWTYAILALYSNNSLVENNEVYGVNESYLSYGFGGQGSINSCFNNTYRNNSGHNTNQLLSVGCQTNTSALTFNVTNNTCHTYYGFSYIVWGNNADFSYNIAHSPPVYYTRALQISSANNISVHNNYIYNGTNGQNLGLLAEHSTTNIYFYNNTIRTMDLGIFFGGQNSENMSAYNNDIRDMPHGASFQANGYGDINNTYVYNNTIINVTEGISILYRKNGAYVYNNTVINSTYSGIIFNNDTHNAIVYDNILYNNTVGIYIGINCTNVTIQNNSIDKAGYQGIYITRADNITVKDLEIKDSTHGILTYNASNLLFENISSHNNIYHGLGIDAGSFNATVRYCNFSNNGGNGLQIWNDGFGLQDGHDYYIYNNTFINNTWDAAIGYRGANLTAENNTIDCNVPDYYSAQSSRGLRALDFSNITFKGNDVKGCQWGILIEGGTDSHNGTIFNNTAHANFHEGIVIGSYDSDWGDYENFNISYNNASSNGNAGIRLDSVDNVTIDHNIAYNNGFTNLGGLAGITAYNGNVYPTHRSENISITNNLIDNVSTNGGDAYGIRTYFTMNTYIANNSINNIHSGLAPAFGGFGYCVYIQRIWDNPVLGAAGGNIIDNSTCTDAELGIVTLNDAYMLNVTNNNLSTSIIGILLNGAGNNQWLTRYENNTASGNNHFLIGSGFGQVVLGPTDIVYWVNNTAYNNQAGFRIGYNSVGFGNADAAQFINNTAYNNQYGIWVDIGSINNNMSGNREYNNSAWEIQVVSGSNNTLEYNVIGQNSTNFSISDASGLSINEGIDPGGAPVHYPKSLNKYLNITNSGPRTINLTYYYEQSEITPEMFESTLRTYRFNATSSQWDYTNSTLNETANSVYSENVSTFGIFNLFLHDLLSIENNVTLLNIGQTNLRNKTDSGALAFMLLALVMGGATVITMKKQNRRGE